MRKRRDPAKNDIQKTKRSLPPGSEVIMGGYVDFKRIPRILILMPTIPASKPIRQNMYRDPKIPAGYGSSKYKDFLPGS